MNINTAAKLLELIDAHDPDQERIAVLVAAKMLGKPVEVINREIEGSSFVRVDGGHYVITDTGKRSLAKVRTRRRQKHTRKQR
jgi:hypothetical protein